MNEISPKSTISLRLYFELLILQCCHSKDHYRYPSCDHRGQHRPVYIFLHTYTYSLGTTVWALDLPIGGRGLGCRSEIVARLVMLVRLFAPLNDSVLGHVNSMAAFRESCWRGILYPAHDTGR